MTSLARRAIGFIVAGLVVTGLIVVALRWLRRGDGEPVVTGPVQVVPDKQLAREPSPRLSLPKRIVRRRVPITVQETRGRPDTVRVRAFARSVVVIDSLHRVIAQLRRDSAAGDTTARPSRVKLPRAVLPPSWGSYNGKVFVWQLTKSDGNKQRSQARVRAPFTFMAGLDTDTDTLPQIVGDQWWTSVARQTVKCAPRAAVLAGLGALLAPKERAAGGGTTRRRDIAAAVAGGLTLVGCLAG